MSSARPFPRLNERCPNTLPIMALASMLLLTGVVACSRDDDIPNGSNITPGVTEHA